MTPEKVAEGKRLVAAAAPGPWRQGASWTWDVFVPYAHALEGPSGERVLLTMNAHYPERDGSPTDIAGCEGVPPWRWEESAAAIVWLFNHAPDLLSAAEALQKAEADVADMRARLYDMKLECESTQARLREAEDVIDSIVEPVPSLTGFWRCLACGIVSRDKMHASVCPLKGYTRTTERRDGSQGDGR